MSLEPANHPEGYTKQQEVSLSKRERRKHRQRKRAEQRVRREKRDAEQPPQPISAGTFALVISLAAVLLLAFIATQFDAVDRVNMFGVSGICIGVAFLIVGTFTAAANFDFEKDSRLGNSLNALSILSTPRKRPGEMFYSQRALYHVFQKILIAIVFPLGFLLALLRPKQTWPAVLWVLAGLLAIVAGILVCYSQGS